MKIKKAHPIFGPPCVRSKTCLGLSSHWNFCISLTPWLPPDFGLINTITGFTEAVGIGFITKLRISFSGLSVLSLDRFLLTCFFFGDFLRLDLKLPLRGSLTIHDGGTTISWWCPENNEQKISLRAERWMDLPSRHSSFTFMILKQTSLLW